MIRILIAEDSITQREILRRVLEAEDEFTVIGEARNGAEAVAMVQRLRPDVVLMDVHMPTMDGVEATRQIMQQCATPVVIVSSTLHKRNIDHGFAALEAGAVAIVEKPKGPALLHLTKIGPELSHAIHSAAQARVKPQFASARTRVSQSGPVSHDIARVEVVGICASTGGPPVLVEILSLLPQPLSLPILLVQHISEAFVDGFGIWLAGRTGQSVRIAGPDQRLGPGVWLAPPGHHLTLGSPAHIKLVPKAPRDIHCPSGNPLFSSLARHVGDKALGVQLTGMGDDGAKGLLELKNAGSQTIIQNETSCMIYGMPKAAKLLGAHGEELTPAQIADSLRQLAGPHNVASSSG